MALTVTTNVLVAATNVMVKLETAFVLQAKWVSCVLRVSLYVYRKIYKKKQLSIRLAHIAHNVC